MTTPEPGSPEWLRYMTASKIAAVVGTSPYESRFSLWHRMNGSIGPQTETAPMSLGNILEPALLAWFQAQHPELDYRPGGWVTHPRIEWAGATPDGFAGDTSLVEAKTARDSWEWRDDQVPAGYRDQCQWQMWVTGTTRTHVVALVDMTLVERVVDIDRSRVEWLINEAEEFMRTLAAGEAPPLDGSMHTYQAVRELHPDISPEDYDVPDDLAVRWLDAKAEVERWTDAERLARTEIADGMGDARRARWNDRTLLTRQAKSGGLPYLVAGRNLPTPNGASDAA